MQKNKFRAALLSFLCISLLLTACGRELRTGEPTAEPTTVVLTEPAQTASATATDGERMDTLREMRGFWMTYAEIGALYQHGERGFYDTLLSNFQMLAKKGFNTVFFHARAFADAFYPSAIFPWSSYLTGTQGVAPGIDPLALAVSAAHACGLQLHAWINPYRVSYNNDITALSDGNPAKQMRDSGNDDMLLISDSGIYFDPSYPEVQRLILDGVREILAAYAVDGIHIDDYFYPTDVGTLDSAEYHAYIDNGGNLSLGDWRRANVNSLVSGMYAAVKTARPDIPFGVSPGGIMDTNYNSYYADVEYWVKNTGYCDYIIPQIYFGFLNKNYGFDPLFAAWTALCDGADVKLYIGLAMYKTGAEDSYAGSAAGREEWLQNSDVVARQIKIIRDNAVCSGFCLFSYTDLVGNQTNAIKAAEAQNVFTLME
ncbi:MAG: family 10 glycosylhydrolase [Clostridia bacterium]|nr:family 10 glycosylhydrolase [Clostridia bacterium]